MEFGWIVENGFSLAQTLGVVGGLVYAGRSFDLDRRTRRTEIFLSLAEAHREIWENMVEHPRLARILEESVDLEAAPVTVRERRFLILLYAHISAVHRAIEEGIYETSPGMERDIAELIRLPIPGIVLRDVLPYQTESCQRYLVSISERGQKDEN